MEHNGLPLFTMKDNRNNDLPVYIRTYGNEEATKGLHAHQMIQINYVVSGSLLHQIHTSQFLINEGDAFVIPPRFPHGIIPIEGQSFTITELECIPEFIWGPHLSLEQFEGFFDFAYIEPFLITEKKVTPRLNIPLAYRGEIDAAFQEIAYEYKNQERGFLFAMKGCIFRLLVKLGRLYAQEVSQTIENNLFTLHAQSIERALSFIDTHFTEPLCIDQVAEIAIVSKSYFCYLFKQLTQKTFLTYLQEKRIQYACELLLQNEALISEIARKSGFTTITHFNRVFKQFLGFSPSIYRKRAGKKPQEIHTLFV